MARPTTPPSTPSPPPAPSTPAPPPGPKKGQFAEELYSVADLAALWHCSRDTIYRLIAAGRLRTVQIGLGRAKSRIPASAAAEFIAAAGTARRRRAA